MRYRMLRDLRFTADNPLSNYVNFDHPAQYFHVSNDYWGEDEWHSIFEWPEQTESYQTSGDSSLSSSGFLGDVKPKSILRQSSADLMGSTTAMSSTSTRSVLDPLRFLNGLQPNPVTTTFDTLVQQPTLPASSFINTTGINSSQSSSAPAPSMLKATVAPPVLNSAVVQPVQTWLAAMTNYVKQYGGKFNTKFYIRELVAVLLSYKWDECKRINRLDIPNWEDAVQLEAHVFIPIFNGIFHAMFASDFSSLSQDIKITCPPSTEEKPNPFSDYLCDVVERHKAIAAHPSTIGKALTKGLKQYWPALCIGPALIFPSYALRFSP
jgi:hypothetical protein